MAYHKPAIEVIQEFQDLLGVIQSPDLPPCAIGPCNQVESLKTAGVYCGAQQDYSYPDLKAGAIVELTSVTPVFTNVKLVISDESATGETTAGSRIFHDDNGDFVTDGVSAGDYIEIVACPDNVSWTVSAVSAQDLEVTRPYSLTEANLTYSVTRDADSTQEPYPIAAGSYTAAAAYLRLLAGIQLDYRDIYSATLLLSYLALRTEFKEQLISAEDDDEIVAQLGVIHPDNPLAFGMSMELQNANTTVYGTGVDTDDSSGFNEAFQFLEDYKVYTLVPLTQDKTVNTLLNAHVNAMSTKEKGKWRVGLINIELPLKQTKQDALTTGAFEDDGVGGYTVFTDVNASFISNSVAINDYIEVTLPAGIAARYKVTGIISEVEVNTLTGPAAAQADITYTATHDRTKDEMATYIKTYSAAFANRRLCNIWPSIAKISVGGIVTDLPGYYYGCAVAGMVGGLPPQQGFTNLAMAGIADVKYSSRYFKESQLNTIASGGTYIIVNDAESAPVYARHQLTTDLSAVKYQELSITKDVDYISYICVDVFKPYLGIYNINQALLDLLSQRGQQIIDWCKAQVVPRAGAVITGGEFRSIKQSTVDQAKVEIVLAVDVPFPSNTIEVTLLV